MNKWIKESIKLANSRGYLDKLSEIYSVDLGVTRELPNGLVLEVKKAFKNKNKLQLMEILLKLPKFPIDDPYVSSLRRHRYLLKQNPKTIKRIVKRLQKLDEYTILMLATRPKSPTRQLGRSFKKWLHTLNYPFCNKEEFEKYTPIAFLNGSENQLKQFTIKNLGIKSLRRRPDFILKIKDKFFIGESKFLTDYGGSQSNQFDGALEMASIRKANKVFGIAVLDGIVWFKSNAYMHQTIKKFKGIVLSALLLKNFIEEQSQEV